MEILFHRKVQKFLDKIPAKNKAIVKKHIDEIIANPQAGDLLEHPFKKYQIRKTSFNYQGQTYRIAYTVTDKKMLFLLIDQRENFYEKLKRMI